MNRIGAGLKQLSERHSFKPEQCILVYDDLDLPIGSVRTRLSGGAGGHNGVASILEAFQTDAFRRVKVGIGQPGAKLDLAQYLLTPFDEVGRAAATLAVASAVERTVEMVSAHPRASSPTDGARCIALKFRFERGPLPELGLSFVAPTSSGSGHRPRSVRQISRIFIKEMQCLALHASRIYQPGRRVLNRMAETGCVDRLPFSPEPLTILHFTCDEVHVGEQVPVLSETEVVHVIGWSRDLPDGSNRSCALRAIETDYPHPTNRGPLGECPDLCRGGKGLLK
jgi:hypothetical protein